MAVMIRFSRQGGKKDPIYSLVAVDKADKRDGAYLEKLGQYWPKADKPEEKFKVNLPALKAWQAKGAQLSQTVGQLLKTLAK